MAGDVFGRCQRCGRLRYLHNGLCDDDASHYSATHGGTIFSESFDRRPTCRNCGGTGVIHHFFSSDEVCPHCGGTGKQ